jgi:tRNA (guanosine-2'-O-)-methyltransferase
MNLTDDEVFPGLWTYLSGFLTDERKQRFENVAATRTRFLTVVVEDIFQPQNASAVLRTCECFGIQDVHIIENENEYQVNPDVVLGASNWLTLHRWNEERNNSSQCIMNLKQQGYRIAATSLHEDAISLFDYSIEEKTALVFGNEADGISDIVKAGADDFVRIPMLGFTESFNISVSAGICLSVLVPLLHRSGLNWKLPEVERRHLLLEWLSGHLENYSLIVERYFKK